VRSKTGADPRNAAFVTLAALLAIAVAALVICSRLDELVRAPGGLPLWDEAAQGFAGLELADAARHFRIVEFLAVLNRQVVWPCVHALLLCPWFLLLGSGFDTPAHMSVALFGATAVLVFASGLALHPARGGWIGAVAAWLLLASPLYRVFGTLGMLEMPGACLLALTLALHARCLGREAPRRGWLVAAGASTAALVLLKYNYGLLWLAPLLAHEWWMMPRERRAAAGARAAAWLRAGGWRRPMPVFVALWTLALAAILVTGGFEFRLAGQRVSIHSAGNPGYALLVVVVAWLVVSVVRAPAAWRARWRALAERQRVLLSTGAAPLLTWFLIPYPNRVKALASFVVNRASGPSPWSGEGLLYYPRAFASDYSPSAAVGWTVLLLALVPAARSHSAARLVWLALVVGLVATAAHRYHDPRFLFTTALLVWLNAARAAVALVDAVTMRLPRLAREAAWVAALIAALVAFRGPADARTRAARAAYRAPEALLPVFDAVLERAARDDEPAALLGYSYALSPGLLSWRAREMHPELALEALPRRAPWLPAGADEARVRARLEALVGRHDMILAALPEPGSPAATPAYRAEVWADSVSRVRLEGDARFKLEAELELPVAGFRVWAFRRRDARLRPPVGEWL